MRKDPGDYTCNLIHPGFNLSEMALKHPKAKLDHFIQHPPLGHAADSKEDVGSTVAFLTSPEASYITGTKMSAGGGINMCIAS